MPGYLVMRSFVFLILILPAICGAQAADPLAGLVERAETLGLAESPVWLRLLHYKRGSPDSQSEILDDDFFLADRGRYSPQDELVATLAAFLQETASEPDETARCRFPARFLFLDTRLGLGLPDVKCPRLERWMKPDQLDSISLMMISGYFGNPASTFGHILLKVNNGSVPDGYTLLDLGDNFGAVVPENELTFVYVVRGLTGGYRAGFSDQDYYRADLTYTRTEFRDMWEYKLNLSEYQQKLLLYHLWEVTGRHFQYFFLKGNCAFRIAELMELVTGSPFVQDVDVWYAPISVFHRLDEVDRRESGDTGLISSIRYRPSAQRVFYAHVAELDDDRDVLDRMILSGGDLSELRGLDAQRKARVLGVLLEYYQYRMAGNLDEEADASLREAKDNAVRARLALPAVELAPRVDIQERRAPSSAAPPSKFALGIGHNAELGAYSFVSVAAFSYETTGNNLLDRSSLIMADLSLGFDSDGLRLEAFDAIRARKVNLNTTAIPGESTTSWEVAFGARREKSACEDCVEAFAEGAIGKSSQLGGQSAVTALVGIDAATGSIGSSGFVRLVLNFGPAARWASELGATYRSYLGKGDENLSLRWISRFSISPRHELKLDLFDDDVLDARLYYAYRW